MLASGGLAVFAAAGFILEKTVIQKSAEQAKNLMTHLQENRGVVIKETICYENTSG